MNQASPKVAVGGTRRFSVHARHIDQHHARLLDEVSFEAAAVAYVEDFHPAVDAGNEVSVIVHEVGTGHQHCFRINVHSGETALCG
ncbi:MAG: DUF5961 family protein [Pseudomonadota bacterium]|nr:DUF5961 family protein [Pseudomonadota bacterium]